MRRALVCAALIAAVFPAAAESISSKQIFAGVVTTPSRSGGAENVEVSVQSWGIKGERRGKAPSQEIPLRGFYLAHVLSGEISTTIDGVTTRHSPGDYWAVKPGAVMQVTALGEYAMLETTVISKK